MTSYLLYTESSSDEGEGRVLCIDTYVAVPDRK